MKVRTYITLSLVVLFVFYSNTLWAEQVPVEKARRVAVNNFNRIIQARALRQQELSADAKAQQQPLPKITEEQITETFTATEKDVLVYYVFNLAPDGWAIISADDVAYPVIGYSLSGLYDPNEANQPAAFTSWMDNVAAEIADSVARGFKGLPDAVEAWKELSVEPADFLPNLAGSKRVKSVPPLIQSTWGQGWDEDCWPYDNDSYNKYCPYEYDLRVICRDYCPTGCVATAMAQIMRYWQWPPFGSGSHGYDPPYECSYDCRGFGWRGVHFNEQYYDWSDSSMPLNTASNAIATLMKHIGIAMEMNYTPSGSSASTSHAADAYREYFRYNGGDYQLKSSYPDTWSGMLMGELCAGRPILYRGDGSGGHAFVCDGYENWGASFHFNWGWDGSYNGYFTLNDLTPGSHDYSNNQAAVLGIEPNSYSGPLDVYVDGDYSALYSGVHDWHDDAFDNINDALLVVGLGGTVHVSPGTYYETIDFKGKPIRLYGIDGPDVTFINGTGHYHVVKCVSGEGPDTVLEGFTVAMGRANDPDNFDDTFGGGMLNVLSSPTVKNCIFTDNSADFGGGAMMNDQSNPTVIDCAFNYNSAEFDGGAMANYQSSPTVTNCTFSNNWTQADGTGHGGGMYNRDNSNPTVTNCTFSDNISTVFGGGMTNYDGSNPTVTNCTFSNNEALLGGGMNNRYNSPILLNCVFFNNSVSYYGGGIYNDESSPVVTNCTFSGNSAAKTTEGDGIGGGMYNWWNSNATLTNCTFSGNSAEVDGGGIYNIADSNVTVTNCILWNDEPDEIFNEASNPNVSYSDVEGGWLGPNNIDADPLFVDGPGGDLRLSLHESPCVDAGDNNAPNLPPTDLAGNPRVADGDRDGTENVDIGAYELPLPTIYNITQARWYDSIQASIDDSNDGDQIEVGPGTYYEAIDFKGKAVHLYSNSGPDATMIDGTGNYHVVQCITGEGPDTVLDGFTITGGYACGSSYFDNCGGGMYNMYNSSPTVTNCTFTSNSADSWGGAMFNSDSSPTVTNCTFIGNTANSGGGGMYNFGWSNPTVTDCNFSGNFAGSNGGGMYNSDSSPTVTNCTFIGNTANSGGGGMYNDSGASPAEPTVTNCTFSRNGADNGGGMFNYWYYGSPKVNNCTFSGNYANNGGGMYNWENSPTVTNCILCGNTPDEIREIWGTATVTYSDVVDGGWGGVGNIDADPCFVDSVADNLRLRPGSPCIEIGDNSAPGIPLTDLDGHPRIIDGDCNGVAVVDMGAYEFNYAYMGDLDYNCAVDFGDFSVFAPAWQTALGQDDYDPACNNSDPPDDYIDWRDLAVIAENWLATAW